MKTILFILIFSSSLFAETLINETVYVESPTDTDHDGVKDKIFVTVSRPLSDKKLSSIYEISPYSTGTNSNVRFHNVDVDFLSKSFASTSKFVHANIKAHSLGTGKSTGCPTIGDKSEILAAKAVIDWLNGRAKGWSENGNEVTADWSNGNVGMTGVSYNGTLPIMVASLGVEGLKAIVPIAAISNWYDYYRANGLVVGPGGYIGEDADVLGYYVVRRGACENEMADLTKFMGREHGDFNDFWQERNHLANAYKIKAATFIIHGQNDWNVKQKQAIQLWEALPKGLPRRMILHKGGHSAGTAFNVKNKIQDWFAFHLDGIENGINEGPIVEVEHADETTSLQSAWPLPGTKKERFYFSNENEIVEFTDMGKSTKIEKLLSEDKAEGRLLFVSNPVDSDRILSGTPQVKLKFAVKNRRAANLTVALVEYSQNGKATIITRGWADAQNHSSILRGEKLSEGKFYEISFPMEPKQYRVKAGSKVGVLVASTDYDYTIRPSAGTIIQVELGTSSFVDFQIEKGL